ncbi:hypothetical protein ACFY4B_30810 [Kitasatospora sp. NPDC001261]|uniref:hypothetical protein n=1 Tax=Kitasatospora sp. NPDC001261 TaxID=3364012 RepID=UPI0036AAB596
MRRLLMLAGVAVAGALVLTGCSGSQRNTAACPPPTGPPVPSSSAVAPAPAVPASPTAAATPPVAPPVAPPVTPHAGTATKAGAAGPGAAVARAVYTPAADGGDPVQLAKGGGKSGSSGSKGSGSKGSKTGRSVHHHIDHYDSDDHNGSGGNGNGHCHSDPTRLPTGSSSPTQPLLPPQTPTPTTPPPAVKPTPAPALPTKR